ncbi:hypothetical protein IG631_18388 [Alternaria alternata]|nr:hypothetical protein IG631_18388 [Alternaria alternata]
MPSMVTSAHCTLVTSTASLFSCMKFWATQPTRTALSSSGAAPTLGVRALNLLRSIAQINMPRSRKRCLHSRMLHGAHPVMATSSCSGAHCSDGSALHALPRCRLQPG